MAISMEDKKIFITLISNILYEPYLQMYLKDAFSLAGRSIEINFLCYAEYKQNPKGVTASDIVVISLNFEELYPDAENIISVQNILEDFLNTVGGQCRELYNYVRKMTYCSVLWLGFEDYYCNSEKWLGAILPLEGLIDEINRKVYQMVTPQDIFIDMKRLIAEIGIRCAYDEKSKYRWNAPYSKILVKRISEEIYAQYLIQMARTRKCLVLDCDNVLWGGVLAEDGVDGIKVGQSGSGRSYQDFQRVLLNLYYHGVILTVCSKNEEQDVLRVFREHSGMVLKEEQIACFQINWDNKPDNIRKISEELSLGLDSMVFVDDSLFEVEAVREILPEVKSILYDRKKYIRNFLVLS